MIRKLQAVRDKLRHEVQKENSDDNSWVALRAVRNRIKSVIDKSKRLFAINAPSSKRPKDVWRVVDRILHPSPKPLQADPDKLNTFLLSTKRTLGTKPDKRSDLIDLAVDIIWRKRSKWGCKTNKKLIDVPGQTRWLFRQLVDGTIGHKRSKIPTNSSHFSSTYLRRSP